jgi:hypothetical protein
LSCPVTELVDGKKREGTGLLNGHGAGLLHTAIIGLLTGSLWDSQLGPPQVFGKLTSLLSCRSPPNPQEDQRNRLVMTAAHGWHPGASSLMGSLDGSLCSQQGL